MKGQIFEMMFYPFFIILILSFFAFSIDETLNEINATRTVLMNSDNAIKNSNQLLLNSSVTHLIKTDFNEKNAKKYVIQRLFIDFDEKTDKFFVKELIFTNLD